MLSRIRHHTSRNARMLACPRIHAYSHTRMHKLTCIRTYLHARRHVFTRAHVHAYIPSFASCKHAYMHTCAHAHSFSTVDLHSRTLLYPRSLLCKLACTCADMYPGCFAVRIMAVGLVSTGNDGSQACACAACARVEMSPKCGCFLVCFFLCVCAHYITWLARWHVLASCLQRAV